MMKISRENYEVFFMDFFDGKLSARSKQELYAFLQLHPDLQAEFDAFDDFRITPETVSYPDKEMLKKPAVIAFADMDAHNYEEFFIAYHEGDLPDKEKIKVETFLTKNPGLQKEFAVYANLKLQPDAEVTFNDKASLKKKRPALLLWRWVGVAAAIALLIGFYFNGQKQAFDRTTLSEIDYMAMLSEPQIVYESTADSDITYRPTQKLLYKETLENRELLAPLPTLLALPGDKMLAANDADSYPEVRLEEMNAYHFIVIQEKIAYFEELQAYNNKNLFGKIAYRIDKQYLAKEELYIDDPNFSFVNVPATTQDLRTFSIAEILPVRNLAKSGRHIKKSKDEKDAKLFLE